MTSLAHALREGRHAQLLRSGLLVLALVVAGLLAWQVARQPGSPVADWVQRRATDATAVALAQPDAPPATYSPGEPLQVDLQVLRTTSEGAQAAPEQLTWTATWETDGGSRVALATGAVQVAPAGTADLPVRVDVPGEASGLLVVTLDGGQRVELHLEPAGG